MRKQQKIGHSLERERTFTRECPKFGHDPAHERNKIWVQFCERSMKTWAQICKHYTMYLRFTMSENTKNVNYTYNFFFFFQSGRAQDSKGRVCSTLRNMPCWREHCSCNVSSRRVSSAWCTHSRRSFRRRSTCLSGSTRRRARRWNTSSVSASSVRRRRTSSFCARSCGSRSTASTTSVRHTRRARRTRRTRRTRAFFSRSG